MSKTSWGTKRKCNTCSSNFYDLNHAPIVCPKCKSTFDPSLAARPKRNKAVKRPVTEVTNAALLKPVAALKKSLQTDKKSKKETGDEDGGDAIGTLMEMDEVDDIESLHELGELEEIEEDLVNEDDADEEALIEDLDAGDNVIVENVEEEEAMAFVKEAGEEEQSGGKKKKSKKSG